MRIIIRINKAEEQGVHDNRAYNLLLHLRIGRFSCRWLLRGDVSLLFDLRRYVFERFMQIFGALNQNLEQYVGQMIVQV